MKAKARTLIFAAGIIWLTLGCSNIGSGETTMDTDNKVTGSSGNGGSLGTGKDDSQNNGTAGNGSSQDTGKDDSQNNGTAGNGSSQDTGKDDGQNNDTDDGSTGGQFLADTWDYEIESYNYNPRTKERYLSQRSSTKCEESTLISYKSNTTSEFYDSSGNLYFISEGNYEYLCLEGTFLDKDYVAEVQYYSKSYYNLQNEDNKVMENYIYTKTNFEDHIPVRMESKTVGSETISESITTRSFIKILDSKKLYKVVAYGNNGNNNYETVSYFLYDDYGFLYGSGDYDEATGVFSQTNFYEKLPAELSHLPFSYSASTLTSKTTCQIISVSDDECRFVLTTKNSETDDITSESYYTFTKAKL